jgi:non-specific serine/threonine protein kinase/serine/threonine-protein kinase
MTEKQALERIGPYKIVRLLGEGGKGQVFEAEQIEPVRRTVALKVLRSSCFEAHDVLRFSAEQQALAMMDHPGIAKVFDAGTEDDGRQWFAMELIDGQPLVEFADTHCLSFSARIELFSRVCRAVHHAHQKGIIHRDLKPSNVLVTIEDGEPKPKVIDFGVAKAVGLRLTDETLLTQFGAIIGTPAYMSPEQADGIDFSIDTRADVYSLGVMLYELLVGCLPVDPRTIGYPGFIAFLKDAAVEAPAPAVQFLKIPVEQQTDLARTRRLGREQLVKQLSGDIRLILAMALEKNTARRYDSAAAFGNDLDAYSRGNVISARAPSIGYVVRKFVVRNRVAVGLSTLLFLALIGGTVASTIGMIRAEREATVANKVSEFLEKTFAEANPFTRAGEEVTARQLLDSAVDNVESDLSGEPLVQGRLLQSVGAAYRGIGLFDAATPLLEQALVLLEQGGASDERIAGIKYDLGYHLVFVSEFERSRQLLDDAIAYYRREHGYKDERLALAIADRVFSSLRAGHGVAESYAMLMQDKEPIISALGNDHPVMGALGHMECWALGNLGRNEDAVACYEESVARLKRIYTVDHPRLGHNTLGLGNAYLRLGQLAKALDSFIETLEINQRLYGAEHPELVFVLKALAITHFELGDRLKAQEFIEDAEVMSRRMHGTQNVEYARTLRLQGDLLAKMGRFDEAVSVLRSAISIKSEVFDARDNQIVWTRTQLAKILLDAGKFDEARATVTSMFEWFPDMNNAPSDLLLTASMVEFRMGNTEEAMAYARLLLEIHKEPYAKGIENYVHANYQFARIAIDYDQSNKSCAEATNAFEAGRTRFGEEDGFTGAALTVLGMCEIQSGHEQSGREFLLRGYEILQQSGEPETLRLKDARQWIDELDLTAQTSLSLPEKIKNTRETYQTVLP